MPKEMCNKCGKDMTMDNDTSVIGVSIMVYPNKDKDVQEFVNSQLGKYAERFRHNFCYECYLDALYRK